MEASCNELERCTLLSLVVQSLSLRWGIAPPFMLQLLTWLALLSLPSSYALASMVACLRSRPTCKKLMLSPSPLQVRMDPLPPACMLPESVAGRGTLTSPEPRLLPMQSSLKCVLTGCTLPMGVGSRHGMGSSPLPWALAPLSASWMGRSLRALQFPSVPAELATEHTSWVAALSLMLARLFPGFATVLCNSQGHLVPIASLDHHPCVAGMASGRLVPARCMCWVSQQDRFVPSR